MKRREFITLLGSAAASPLAAWAQEMRRVGALLSLRDNDPEGKVWLRAFQDELQKLGWRRRGGGVIVSQVSHGRVGTSPGLLPSKPRLSANGLNCLKTPLQAGTEWRSF